MTLFKKVATDQDREPVLRLLLAQRRQHSKAKNWVGVQLAILVVLPMLAATWTQFQGCPAGITTLVSMITLIVDVVIVEPWIRESVEVAVNFQEQIDCSLFGLPWPVWKMEPEIPAGQVCPETKDELLVLVKEQNLLGWYKDPKTTRSPQHVILGLQKQNVFYSAQLRGGLLKIFIPFVLCLCLMGLIFAFFMKTQVSDLVACPLVVMLPLFAWMLREIAKLRSFRLTASHLQNEMGRVANQSFDPAILRNIQDEIIEFRKGSPVVFDFYYRWRRPKLEKAISV
ncbi:MAG TPA: S-4TM family putative pore-forming effector [bacterium]|jgi:hypothetical protein|nr:S-4TM family putative pore-forming effector [bacterium]